MINVMYNILYCSHVVMSRVLQAIWHILSQFISAHLFWSSYLNICKLLHLILGSVVAAALGCCISHGYWVALMAFKLFTVRVMLFSASCFASLYLMFFFGNNGCILIYLFFVAGYISSILQEIKLSSPLSPQETQFCSVLPFFSILQEITTTWEC